MDCRCRFNEFSLLQQKQVVQCFITGIQWIREAISVFSHSLTVTDDMLTRIILRLNQEYALRTQLNVLLEGIPAVLENIGQKSSSDLLNEDVSLPMQDKKKKGKGDADKSWSHISFSPFDPAVARVLGSARIFQFKISRESDSQDDILDDDNFQMQGLNARIAADLIQIVSKSIDKAIVDARFGSEFENFVNGGSFGERHGQTINELLTFYCDTNVFRAISGILGSIIEAGSSKGEDEHQTSNSLSQALFGERSRDSYFGADSLSLFASICAVISGILEGYVSISELLSIAADILSSNCFFFL